MATFDNTASATFTAGLIPVSKISNTVSALLASDNFSLVKSQSQTVLFPSTVQTYTIVGTNNIGVNVTLFTLTDIIPLGLEYVNNSFTVDGIAATPTVVANTLTYVFGAWADGATHTFSFQCERNS